MPNVIYGHFESAGSLYKQIANLCQGSAGFDDTARMVRLYAGAIAECLLDYEDWMDGLENFFGYKKELEKTLNPDQWDGMGYGVKPLVLDRDTELGRALVRTYLDENIESSYLMLRNIRASLFSLVPKMNSNFWTGLYDITCTVLVSEQMIHTLCDQIIDIYVGGEGWSLGDCIQGLGALAGQYHACSLNNQSLGSAMTAVIAHDFEMIVQVIMNEAKRLGMGETIATHAMVAANDTLHSVPLQKALDIERIAIPLFNLFFVKDTALKSMHMAKATGRMMAVAAAGDAADMDSCVVTPLALSSLQGSYHYTLAAK